MPNHDNVKLNAHTIPANYQNGLNIAGFHFKPRFIIEGILIGLVCVVSFFMVFWSLSFINFGSKIGFTLALSAMGFLLGCKGINDEPLSEYLINYLRFKNKRRTAYYNPRVKLESISYTETIKKKEENSAINKAMTIIDKVKAKMIEKDSEKTESYQNNNYFDAEKMFFADDEGIIEKPKEYMDDKELSMYEKKEIERQKKILKMAKELERKERYENG